MVVFCIGEPTNQARISWFCYVHVADINAVGRGWVTERANEKEHKRTSGQMDRVGWGGLVSGWRINENGVFRCYTTIFRHRCGRCWDVVVRGESEREFPQPGSFSVSFGFSFADSRRCGWWAGPAFKSIRHTESSVEKLPPPLLHTLS